MKFELSLPQELERAKKERWPIIMPLGPLEYHGWHCVYGTDVLIPLGILERFEKLRDAKMVILPPFWYGPASYAVASAEKGGSINVSYDALEHLFKGIFMSLLRNGWRNIYVLIAHQTEDLNPMQLSLMKAAKAVTFEFLQNRDGEGWWGNCSNTEFYSGMDSIEHPWNWIRVIGPLDGLDRKEIQVSSDHAGIWETSTLLALYPECVKLDLALKSDDWFCVSGADATVELGEKKIAVILKNMDRMVKRPLSDKT